MKLSEIIDGWLDTFDEYPENKSIEMLINYSESCERRLSLELATKAYQACFASARMSQSEYDYLLIELDEMGERTMYKLYNNNECFGDEVPEYFETLQEAKNRQEELSVRLYETFHDEALFTAREKGQLPEEACSRLFWDIEEALIIEEWAVVK